MEGNKLKLVNYSESSESSSSPEPEIEHQYPKIAVVNPVQCQTRTRRTNIST